MSRYLTPADVAAELQCSPRYVSMLVARGELPALRVGRLSRIRREDLDEWLRQRTGRGVRSRAQDPAS